MERAIGMRRIGVNVVLHLCPKTSEDKKMPNYTPDFESFWKAYPRKKSKAACFKHWQRLKNGGELPEMRVLLDAIYKQKKERIFLKSQNRFVPEWKHASTWINQGCWDDDCELGLQVARTSKGKNSNGLANMQRALNILTNVSEAKFHEFCKGVDMPDNDKEAVLNKYNMVYDVKKLAGAAVKGV